MKQDLSNVFYCLFTSRKFWLALLAVIQTIVSHYFNVPVEVWASIDALAAVVIVTIAYEDGANTKAYYDAALEYYLSNPGIGIEEVDTTDEDEE